MLDGPRFAHRWYGTATRLDRTTGGCRLLAERGPARAGPCRVVPGNGLRCHDDDGLAEEVLAQPLAQWFLQNQFDAVEVHVRVLVGAFETVDQRPALDGDGAANGIDRGMRHRQPDGHRQVQRHHIANPPGAGDPQVSPARVGGHRRRVDGRGGAATPRGYPQRQRPWRVRGTGDGQRYGSVQRVPGVQRYRREGGVDGRGQVLVDLDAGVVVGGDVAGERGDRPHDVGRAARAREPVWPSTRRLGPLRPGVRRGGRAGDPALGRVVVEERVALDRGGRREEVVQRPLDRVGEPTLTGGQQQTPGQHDARDRRRRSRRRPGPAAARTRRRRTRPRSGSRPRR